MASQRNGTQSDQLDTSVVPESTGQEAIIPITASNLYAPNKALEALDDSIFGKDLNPVRVCPPYSNPYNHPKILEDITRFFGPVFGDDYVKAINYENARTAKLGKGLSFIHMGSLKASEIDPELEHIIQYFIPVSIIDCKGWKVRPLSKGEHERYEYRASICRYNLVRVVDRPTPENILAVVAFQVPNHAVDKTTGGLRLLTAEERRLYNQEAENARSIWQDKSKAEVQEKKSKKQSFVEVFEREKTLATSLKPRKKTILSSPSFPPPKAGSSLSRLDDMAMTVPTSAGTSSLLAGKAARTSFTQIRSHDVAAGSASASRAALAPKFDNMVNRVDSVPQVTSSSKVAQPTTMPSLGDNIGEGGRIQPYSLVRHRHLPPTRPPVLEHPGQVYRWNVHTKEMNLVDVPKEWKKRNRDGKKSNGPWEGRETTTLYYARSLRWEWQDIAEHCFDNTRVWTACRAKYYDIDKGCAKGYADEY